MQLRWWFPDWKGSNLKIFHSIANRLPARRGFLRGYLLSFSKGILLLAKGWWDVPSRCPCNESFNVLQGKIWTLQRVLPRGC